MIGISLCVFIMECMFWLVLELHYIFMQETIQSDDLVQVMTVMHFYNVSSGVVSQGYSLQ